MKLIIWTPTDKAKLDAAKDLGIVEFKTQSGDDVIFHILSTPERLVFGTPANNCFLESGYITPETGESLNETLQELLSDLETYYRDGKSYTTRIVCNERM